MSDAPIATLALPCAKCSLEFKATISTATMAAFDRAGVSPEEVLESIDRGLLSWQVTCRECASTAQN